MLVPICIAVLVAVFAVQRVRIFRLQSRCSKLVDENAGLLRACEAWRLDLRRLRQIVEFREVAIGRARATERRLREQIADLESAHATNGIVRTRCGLIVVEVEGQWFHVIRYPDGSAQLALASPYEVDGIRQHAADEADRPDFMSLVMAAIELGLSDGSMPYMVLNGRGVAAAHTMS